MKFDEQTIDHVANLARISLSAEEKKLYTSQISHILEYIEKLNRLDTSTVSPLGHLLTVETPLRPDTLIPSLTPTEALQTAPEQEQGYFCVPRVIREEDSIVAAESSGEALPAQTLAAYEPVIGLEIHAQLLSHSKIFCGCSSRFGSGPNSHTCPICLGHPGTLPVLNQTVVAMAVKAALALECRINETSVFARKNYFYPDLPKGYQISQYELPLAEAGSIQIESDQRLKTIRIRRIHLEEDAGKSIHAEEHKRAEVSHIDLNRCGVPLIEIVTEPDLGSSSEAATFLKQLRAILMYLEVCDGNMEEGSFRCDANISVRRKGQSQLGTRAELKNINSFRFVQKAIDYEITRQIAILENGGEIHQETRLWDEKKQITAGMRGKEEAHDYRYFPDPDLIPLKVGPEFLARLGAEIPELPSKRRERFISAYGLPAYDADILTSSRELADFFESTIKAEVEPKTVSNWMMGELLRQLNSDGLNLSQTKLTPVNLASLLKLLGSGTINAKLARQIFQETYKTGQEPEKIMAAQGVRQISDEAELRRMAETIVARYPEQVKAYQAGKTSLIGYFVGEVMKASRGQANPGLVGPLLKEILEQKKS
jgi:aspartyl-tRNA(Asn)/glutamyl-tRNA(Gln) amidotransferase subunit B